MKDKKFKVLNLKTMKELKGGKATQRVIATNSASTSALSAFGRVDVELEITLETEVDE